MRKVRFAKSDMCALLRVRQRVLINAGISCWRMFAIAPRLGSEAAPERGARYRQ